MKIRLYERTTNSLLLFFFNFTFFRFCILSVDFLCAKFVTSVLICRASFRVYMPIEHRIILYSIERDFKIFLKTAILRMILIIIWFFFSNPFIFVNSSIQRLKRQRIKDAIWQHPTTIEPVTVRFKPIFYIFSYY